MSTIPTLADFATRGLYEVELDGPRPTAEREPATFSPAAADREQRTTGRALFRPAPGYPPSQRGAEMLKEDGLMWVRFRCVSGIWLSSVGGVGGEERELELVASADFLDCLASTLRLLVQTCAC